MALPDYGRSSKRNKSFIEAEKTLQQIVPDFHGTRRSPQAIAALLRGWNIIRPTAHDFRSYIPAKAQRFAFFGHWQNVSPRCRTRNSPPSLKCISLVKYPAQQVLRKAGENESTLFFVVYGNLISSPPDDNGPPGGDSARILKENDFFGDRHPYSEKKSVGNLVKTLTEVELIQISKTGHVDPLRRTS